MNLKKLGGQAVIEGVMMRTENAFSVAVRKPDGTVSLKTEKWESLWKKYPLLKFPVLRGCVVLYETLYNGLSSLAFSAKETSGEEQKITSGTIITTMIVAVGFSFLIFAAIPHILTVAFGYLSGSEGLSGGKDVIFHAVDGILKIVIFGVFLLTVSQMKDMKRVFQYHGAEHKVVFAYEAGEPLEIDNIRKYSTRHPRCGTSFLLIVILVSILIFTVVFPFIPKPFSSEYLNQIIFIILKLFLIFPIAGISYEVIKLGDRKKKSSWLIRLISVPGLMLQAITTKEPDDSQIEVAVKAATAALDEENQIVGAGHVLP
jgi:uncharacterized protein YqhQ